MQHLLPPLASISSGRFHPKSNLTCRLAQQSARTRSFLILQEASLDQLRFQLSDQKEWSLGNFAAAVDIPHVGTLTSETSIVGGAAMILGALAYRSAKKRRYGEAKTTLTRHFLEFALLVPIFVVIFAAILSPADFTYLAETNSVPNLAIAIGAIAAYLVNGFMPPVNDKV